MHETKFQKEIIVKARLAVDWLVRSINVCNNVGSSAFYSRFYCPLRGWSWPYPETTGYIIPTLINYSKFSNQEKYAELAIKQADWVMSLQYEDGALPDGLVKMGEKSGPSIFNTGQMILGLVAAFDLTQEEKYLEIAFRAASWLASNVDESTGTWEKHSYIAGYSPAYYTRVAWPMLEVNSRKADNQIKDAAVQVLDTILNLQQQNGAIKNWGFKAGTAAFTHTIAYTIRGFLESGYLLGDEGHRFKEAAETIADTLRKRMELRGKLAGAYDLKLKGKYCYTCLTGNCQMSLVWMKIYLDSSDARFFSAALKSLEYVASKQRIRSIDPNVRGAIGGSSPLWGRYLTLRYPNWAAKFYLDALLLAYQLLQKLLEKGPCEL